MVRTRWWVSCRRGRARSGARSPREPVLQHRGREGRRAAQDAARGMEGSRARAPAGCVRAFRPDLRLGSAALRRSPRCGDARAARPRHRAARRCGSPDEPAARTALHPRARGRRLARALAESDDLPSALARSSRDRRNVLWFYRRASRWITPPFESDDSLPGTLRDATFPVFSRLPFFERRMIETMAGLSTGLLSAS